MFLVFLMREIIPPAGHQLRCKFNSSSLSSSAQNNSKEFKECQFLPGMQFIFYER